MAKNKQNNEYFNAFCAMADCSARAAGQLNGLMTNFRAHDLEQSMAPLHAVEHESDMVLHKAMEKLIHEFITPIEREDITSILNLLDTVVDDIEDVAIKAHMFNVKTVRSECLQFCEIISKCAVILKETVGEFENFKKSKNLRQLFIGMNTLEEEADNIYIHAVSRLYKEADAMEAVIWTQMFDALERCCDDFEHASYGIECAVLKNS